MLPIRAYFWGSKHAVGNRRRKPVVWIVSCPMRSGTKLRPTYFLGAVRRACCVPIPSVRLPAPRLAGQRKSRAYPAPSERNSRG
jgi:hypothetical protein